MLSDRHEGKIQLAFDLIADRTREANSTRLSDAFQPRSNIHSVAEQVVALHHHVAQIHANSEFHPPLAGKIGVVTSKRALDGHCGAHGLHRAAKLCNHAVSGAAENPSSVFAYQI
jgi:hypothetical protein